MSDINVILETTIINVIFDGDEINVELVDSADIIIDIVEGIPGPPGTTLHSGLSDVTADQHHNEDHTIVSHDTDATGPELDILTDGSDAETLHNHDIDNDANYLRKDTTNDPLTGDLEIEKADPKSRLTDSGNGKWTEFSKSDTNNEAKRVNQINWNNVGANTKLLLHGEGSDGGIIFIDSSSYVHIVTRIGTKITTESAQKKFGVSSIYSTGAHSTGPRLSIPSANFNYAAQDFCIDFWAYPQGVGNENIYDTRSAAAANMTIFLYLTSGVLKLYASSDGTNSDIANAVVIGALPTGSWQHIEVSRTGDNWYMFVDGILSGNEFNDAAAIFTTAETIALMGFKWSINYSYTGYIDEFRVIIGAGGHTSNFTPPSAPYGIGTKTMEVCGSSDSDVGGDEGIAWVGDTNSLTEIRGRRIPFILNGVQVGEIETDGTLHIENNLQIDGITYLNSAFIGDGGVTDYTAFANDGILTMVGTARVIKTIELNVGAISLHGVNVPTLTDLGIGKVLRFSDAGVNYEIATTRIQIPKDMDTSVQPKIVICWSSATADPGNDSKQCRWQIAYLPRTLNESFAAAAEDIITDNYSASITANGCLMTEVQLANVGSSDVCIIVQVARRSDDGGDTLGDNADLQAIHLQYASNKLGTAT